MLHAIRHLIFAGLLLSSLTACERLGIADPAKEAAARDAEGRAIGGACRQSGRALEDCYTLNQGALKSAVFEGWREMNDYMMQNKLEAVKPEFPVPGALPRRRQDADPATDSSAAAATSEPSEENMSAADRRRARLAERRKRAAEASGAAAEPAKAATKDKAAAH
jgi:hypothetical protein